MSSENLRKTQIPVTMEVREEIKKRGGKGEKYDEILRRLLGMTQAQRGEVAP
jgi:hypothetical protein